MHTKPLLDSSHKLLRKNASRNDENTFNMFEVQTTGFAHLAELSSSLRLLIGESMPIASARNACVPDGGHKCIPILQLSPTPYAFKACITNCARLSIFVPLMHGCLPPLSHTVLEIGLFIFPLSFP